MAGLTENLGVPMSGREAVSPAPSGNSIFANLLSVGTQALGAVQGAAEVRNDRAKRQRAALENSREDAEYAHRLGERAAKDDAAQAFVDVNTDSGESATTDTLAIAARGDAAAAGQEIGRLSTAARQGRAKVDNVTIRTEMALRRLFAAHPDYKAEILEEMNKYAGSSSPLLADYKRAAARVEEEEKAELRADTEAIDYSINTLGMNPDLPRAELLSSGRKAMAAEKLLDIQNTRSQILERQTNITAAEMKVQREQLSDDSFVAANNLFGENVNAQMKSLFNLIQRPDISPSDKEKALLPVVRALQTQGKMRIDNILNKYGPTMTPERRKELQERMEGQLKDLVTMFNGPLSDIESQARVLKGLQDTFNINGIEAFPIYNQIKEVFGSSVVSEEFIAQNFHTGPYKDAIARELQGFNLLDRGNQRARMTNLISILKGETGLRDYSPAEARQMMPGLINTLRGLAQHQHVRTGADPDAHRTALIAYGQLGNAALDSVPQWGATNLVKVMSYLTHPSTTMVAFGSRGNADMQGPVRDTIIPAVQRTMLSLRDAPNSDPYYKVVYQNGKFVIAGTGKKPPKAFSPSTMAPGAVPVGIAPSKETKDRVTQLNQALNWLSRAQTEGFDKDVPKSVTMTDRERRDMYATGRIPQALRKDQEAKGNPTREFFTTADKLRKEFSEAVNAEDFVAGEPLNLTGNSRGERNNNPGNLEDGPFTKGQPGYVGSDGRFAKFDTMENGAAAQANLLKKNYFNKGLTSVNSILMKYAPPARVGGDNSEESWNNYAAYVAKRLGIGRGDAIPENMIGRLAQAMREFETGNTVKG